MNTYASDFLIYLFFNKILCGIIKDDSVLSCSCSFRTASSSRCQRRRQQRRPRDVRVFVRGRLWGQFTSSRCFFFNHIPVFLWGAGMFPHECGNLSITTSISSSCNTSCWPPWCTSLLSVFVFVQVWDVNMQDLCSGSLTLDRFKAVVFVGGFSYADVLGSAKGKAPQARLNNFF